MVDHGVPPPQFHFSPPPPSSVAAAPTANGLLSTQHSPAALEVSAAMRENERQADLLRRTQAIRDAAVERDRTQVVLPAMHAWQQGRPHAKRIVYPATCARLGAVGFAGYSVVRHRGEPRAVSSVVADAAGYAVLGGVLGYGFGSVLADVVDVARPPAPIPVVMPTEVRAALVKEHNPPIWRRDGWLVAWRELAVELNGYSAAGGNGAATGLGEVASIMKAMRG